MIFGIILILGVAVIVNVLQYYPVNASFQDTQAQEQINQSKAKTSEEDSAVTTAGI